MRVVILAGGGGKRLWPLSRRAAPKQFQPIIGGVPLVTQTYDRLRHAFSDDVIFIAVGAETLAPLRSVLPDFSQDHIIVEPERRDTGPAIGYIAATLALDAPDEPVTFVASDHYIHDHEALLRTIQLAGELTVATGSFVNVGVRPSYPSTQLGYLHLGKQREERDGIAVYQSLGQTEKPNAQEAQAMVASGEYLWNCAYFTWTPRQFLDAYKKFAPQIAEHLQMIQRLLKDGRRGDIPAVYRKMEKISVDYALMEHLEKEEALILAGTFDWDDVGLWSAVHRLQQESAESNVESGASVVAVDTKNSLVVGPKGKVIATIGLDGMVIVDTPDALLVCAKDRSADVKRIVEQLQDKSLTTVL